MGFFDVTEINSSFYHLPQVSSTRDWNKKSPAGFKFCPKMSRYLTHMKKLKDPEETLGFFFDAFRPLKRKTGPILIQLPAILKFNIERATHLYKLLKKKYGYYSFAIEVRHDSWLSAESIALMKQYNIALVVSQSGSGFPYSELVTAENIYIRFHGPGALYASSYTHKQLKYYATIFKKWARQGHHVWAFFNNDIHGYATKNALRLKKILKV